MDSMGSVRNIERMGTVARVACVGKGSQPAKARRSVGGSKRSKCVSNVLVQQLREGVSEFKP